jgi:hypothetical protein
MEFISQPWPWYVAGPLIALVMITLTMFSKSFGFSANLRTMCSIGGAGKRVEFFNFDWKSQIWNLVFLAGAIIGGYIAANYLTSSTLIALSSNTVASLASLGIENAGSSFLPTEIFGLDALSSIGGIAYLVVGGLLIGFGSRYAGGCTSGHAITGLSALQLPSLIAVIGFFIGGLIMTFFILPIIL